MFPYFLEQEGSLMPDLSKGGRAWSVSVKVIAPIAIIIIIIFSLVFGKAIS